MFLLCMCSCVECVKRLFWARENEGELLTEGENNNNVIINNNNKTENRK